MFERFTKEARQVVMTASHEARQLRHPQLGTEHLLLAMVIEPGVAGTVLRRAGLTPERVRADIERLAGRPDRLLSDEDAAALRTIGIDLDAVLSRIEESFGPDALNVPAPPARRGLFGRAGGGQFTRRAKKVLELALREALRLDDRSLRTEHLLLGIVRDGGGLAARILTDAQVDLDDLRASILDELGRAA